jgi:hypothetical protein
MSADLTKRIMVRVTDEQLAWIGEMAADEGMDNATFVRVVLDRLSKGRAPLIGMMAQQTFVQPFVAPPQPDFDAYGIPIAVPRAAGESTDILAQRAAEAEANLPPRQEAESDHPEESAAIPLRRVQRERYNPGRQ